MGGERSGSSSGSGSGTGRPAGSMAWEAEAMAMGSEVELIRVRNAYLFLIDGQESVLMQTGDLALVLQKQQRTPLAACVAMVGEVEWPVGKDAPVLRIADGRYSFALPGFVYGVVLPPEVTPDVVRRLEHLLRQYATFEPQPDKELAGIDAQARSTLSHDPALYWTAVAPEVERSSWRLARQISTGSTAAATSIVKSAEWAALGIQKGGAFIKSHSAPTGQGPVEISPRMLKRVQQARRLSAVAKLFSRTLMKGAISATNHVANNLGTALVSTSAGRSFQESAVRDVAVAGVDAFGKVVEAVESAGRAILETSASVGTDIVQHRYGVEAVPLAEDSLGAVGNVISTAWTLNKMGLRMLLRTLAASTAVNVVQGGRQPSDASASSTSSQTANLAHMSLASQASSLRGSPVAQLDSQVSISLPTPPVTAPMLQTTQFFPMASGTGPAAVSRGNTSTSSPHIAPTIASPFREYTRVSQSQDQSQSSFPYPRVQGR